jgi:hypothetical protein
MWQGSENNGKIYNKDNYIIRERSAYEALILANWR